MDDAQFDPMELEGPMIHTVYRDLDQLHEGIDESAKGLERLAGLFREYVVDNEGTTMLAATLESIASQLERDLAYIREVQERIRSHGLAPEEG